MNKKDYVLLAVLLTAAIVMLIPLRHRALADEAYIYVNGDLYGIYDLGVPQDIHIDNNGIGDDIAISGGTVYMKDATCPGRQCVASGHISRANESICCAPAGVLIVVHSDKNAEYDAITR